MEAIWEQEHYTSPSWYGHWDYRFTALWEFRKPNIHKVRISLGLSIKVMRYRSYKVVFKAHRRGAMGVKEVMESYVEGHRAIRDHRNDRLSQGIHRIVGSQELAVLWIWSEKSP